MALTLIFVRLVLELGSRAKSIKTGQVPTLNMFDIYLPTKPTSENGPNIVVGRLIGKVGMVLDVLWFTVYPVRFCTFRTSYFLIASVIVNVNVCISFMQAK